MDEKGAVGEPRTDFISFLQNKENHPAWIEFLKTQYNEDNFFFWLDVETYRESGDAATRKERAGQIYNSFLSSRGLQCLNLEQQFRENVENIMKSDNYPTTLFDETQEEIFAQMLSNSYSKFKAAPKESLVATKSKAVQKKEDGGAWSLRRTATLSTTTSSLIYVELTDSFWCGSIDGTITIVTNKHKVKEKFEAHSAPVLNMVLVSEFVWTSGEDKRLKVWSQENHQLIKEFNLDSPVISFIQFGNALLGGCMDGQLISWNSNPHQNNEGQRTMDFNNPVRCLSLDGSLLIVGAGSEIHVIGLPFMEKLFTHSGNNEVSAILFSNQSFCIWAAFGSSIVVFRLKESKIIDSVTLDQHPDNITNLVKSGDYVWSVSNQRLLLWEIQSREMVVTIETPKESLVHGLLSFNEDTLVSVGEKVFCVWSSKALKSNGGLPCF